MTEVIGQEGFSAKGFHAYAAPPLPSSSWTSRACPGSSAVTGWRPGRGGAGPKLGKARPGLKKEGHFYCVVHGVLIPRDPGAADCPYVRAGAWLSSVPGAGRQGREDPGVLAEPAAAGTPTAGSARPSTHCGSARQARGMEQGH